MLAPLALLAVVVAALPGPGPRGGPVPVPTELRLYALDCGHMDVQDMAPFSDTGEYDGKPGEIVAPCFLIGHPKGWLLWDAGLGDALVGAPRAMGGFHLSAGVTLKAQLAQLGLKPEDISYVAFSHLHFDHTGNANLFTSATWILQRAELAWALSTPTPGGVDTSTFSAYKAGKQQMIDGDDDVFGDGTVRILFTPGHTPGHQSLVLKLRDAGIVILSGDLYHLRENHRFHRVPVYNVNRAETLASMARVDTIIAHTHARLIVQHDPMEFRALPKFPAYLH